MEKAKEIRISFRKQRMKMPDAGAFSRLVVIAFIFFLKPAHCDAQVTPFEKSVLDSLEANDFNGSISWGFNVGQDGTSTFVTNSDIGLMYSTRRSNYQLLESAYFSRYESFNTVDRYFVMGIASLYSHDLVSDSILTEKKIYPEPFTLLTYDANRGLNSRWQTGIDAVYAFKPTKIIRLKMGLGILYELENWQMVQRDSLYKLDSLPQNVRDYLFKTIGIDQEGRLYINNVRANLFANCMSSFGPNVNLNAFIDIQIPFVPPYHNLPQIPQFPVVTKLYPRVTVDMQLTVKIWKKLGLLTSFYMQYDKGQVPLYVPNFVYSLTQGIQFEF
ncbi:MAG: hypothetical protein ACHQET_12535 [Chitinophagales bacterium]